MNKTITLGKVDYYSNGRKDHAVEIDIRLEDGSLGICGSIWNRRHSDILCGGQCHDEIDKYFSNNSTWQTIFSIWKECHLNDMQPGSPRQMLYLETIEDKDRPLISRKYKDKDEWSEFRHDSHYDWACYELKEKGLLVDEYYLHEGKPYRYGTAWLRKELPARVLKQLEEVG